MSRSACPARPRELGRPGGADRRRSSSEGFRVNWTPDLAISLGYLVFANSLVSMTLLLMMVRRNEAARVSALFFLVPPLAALIAWALLGESLPALAWIGTAAAAAGVAVATRITEKQ